MAAPFEELEKFYPEIIAQMPDRFNSHEFILALAHHHQPEYIHALEYYSDRAQPFMIVHGRLAKLLEERYSHLIRHVGTEPSRDIFGQQNGAALWVKLERHS